MGEDGSTGSNGGGSRRSRKKGGGKKPHQQPKAQKFTGDCEELKGHVFDVDSYSPSDNFKKTLEQLVKYIGRDTGYKFGGMVAQGVEMLKTPTVEGCLSPDRARLLLENPQEFADQARKHTQQHAAV